MTDFETMAIDDPGVLQGCMDLSFKTPAQLLMEFQSKHKGITVNYVTSSLAPSGSSMNDRSRFQVVASVGPSAAEGVAGNKKVAKQFAAQALLAKLNPHVTTYCDLIRLHENTVKNHVDAVRSNKVQKIGHKHRGNMNSATTSLLPQPGGVAPEGPSNASNAANVGATETISESSHGYARSGNDRSVQLTSGYGGSSYTNRDPRDPRRRNSNHAATTASHHAYGSYAAPEVEMMYGYLPFVKLS
jgi:hypothetical protein